VAGSGRSGHPPCTCPLCRPTSPAVQRITAFPPVHGQSDVCHSRIAMPPGRTYRYARVSGALRCCGFVRLHRPSRFA
jgi:hypothetical protein